MNMETPKISVAQQRQKQILSAIDAIAARDELPFLTTKRVSQASKVSDGVLFRHFSSKEMMLTAWLESRAEQLRMAMEAMPAGRDGLLFFVQQLMNKPVLHSFVCCLPMDVPYLRQALESCRLRMRQLVTLRISLLASASLGVDAELLSDHLMQSIYRSWNPNDHEHGQHKERLMHQLPWEKTDPTPKLLPEPEVLQRLALNDSGFVFDPVNGRSFTANTIGLYVLRFLQQHDDEQALYDAVAQDFAVSKNEAERDLTEFFAQLRKFLS